MYYTIPQFVPIQLQTVAAFTAPDPWNGNVPAQWTLSVYRMTTENNQSLYVNYSAEKQQESSDGQNLDSDDVLGLRSSVDGLYHILPAALVLLWQQGRVRNVELPALIIAVEPRLARRDFFDPVARQPWRRYIAHVAAAIGALLAAVGVWVAASGPHTGTFAELGSWFWFFLAIILWLFAGVLFFMIAVRQRRLAQRESEFIALLSQGAGVFPGRPA